MLRRTGRRGYGVGEKERARRANETAEQKERRLRQRRERDRARRATQVTEEREARLLQLMASQRERLAAESAEERGPAAAVERFPTREASC